MDMDDGGGFGLPGYGGMGGLGMPGYGGMGGLGFPGYGGMGGFGGEGDDEDEEGAAKGPYAGAGAGEERDDPPAEMKEGEEREIGKEGLKKLLVKEGEGWARPSHGDEVHGACDPHLGARFWVSGDGGIEGAARSIAKCFAHWTGFPWRSALHGDADGRRKVRFHPGP
jgi:hypothetical protein